jgi:DNA-binding NarL/FixJ family response regulator
MLKARHDLRVFIADDSSLMRERLAAAFSDIDNVELAGQAVNVQEAIEAILRLKPDVVILDIRMPGGSGLQVLEQVRTGPSPPTVIILTAFPLLQYRKRSEALGAAYFFDKPSDFDRMVEVVRQLAADKFARASGNPGGGIAS